MSCVSVPVEQLDYSFIQSCTDVRQLERIIRVLRSGREGCYPHLLEFCERRVEQLDPRARALWRERAAASAACFSPQEWRSITEDLQLWEVCVRASDADLRRRPVCRDEEETLPPVRCSRFDVRSECAVMDESEGNLRPAGPAVTQTVISAALWDQEKALLGRREKDKGNEAFRSGDFQEAVAYYSRSLALTPSAAALNNRAQAHLRLERWTEALSDCHAVLQLEPHNAKALLRRATAHKHLGHLQESHDDLRAVLQIEPHNRTAQLLMEEADERQERRGTGRKIPIQEEEEEEEEDAASQSRQDTRGITGNTHATLSSSSSSSTRGGYTHAGRRQGGATGADTHTGATPTGHAHLTREEEHRGTQETHTHAASEHTAAGLQGALRPEERETEPQRVTRVMKDRRLVSITEVEDEDERASVCVLGQTLPAAAVPSC